MVIQLELARAPMTLIPQPFISLQYVICTVIVKFIGAFSDIDNNFIKFNYQIGILPRGDFKINFGNAIQISSGPMTLLPQPFILLHFTSVRDRVR